MAQTAPAPNRSSRLCSHGVAAVCPINWLLSKVLAGRVVPGSVLHVSVMVHVPAYMVRILRENGINADYLAVGHSPWWRESDYQFRPTRVPRSVGAQGDVVGVARGGALRDRPLAFHDHGLARRAGSGRCCDRWAASWSSTIAVVRFAIAIATWRMHPASTSARSATTGRTSAGRPSTRIAGRSRRATAMRSWSRRRT